MKKVVITGANGFLGKHLSQYFLNQGMEVVGIAREGKLAPSHIPQFTYVSWDGETLGDWVHALEGTDAIINLAGRTVNCRYHQKNKEEILESRTHTTHLIAKAIEQCKNPPQVWLNSSTATIYRDEHESPNDEYTGVIGEGFSVEVAKSWEEAFFRSKTPEDIRKVALRTAIVIGNEKGSVYEYFNNISRFGAGGKMGTGTQKVSWVHIEDWCRAIELCIENQAINGAINIAAPEVLSNEDFMAIFAKQSGCPIRLQTPKFLIQLGTFLLRTEAELVLKSRWIKSTQLKEHGFEFKFPDLKRCLENLENRPPTQLESISKTNKAFQYGLLTVVVLGLIAYRLLVVTELEQSSLLFVGIPVLLSFLVVGSKPSKSCLGAIYKAITFCCLLLLIFAIEGIICVLMAAPLLYGIGGIIGWAFDHIKNKQNRTKVQLTLLPLLALMSLEGTFSEFHFPREQEVVVEKTLNLPSEQVLPLLAKGPNIHQKKPWFLKIGFPEPQNISGEGLELGSTWKIHMAGGEGKPGDLIIRVTEKSENHIKTNIVEDTSHLNHWLTWHDVTYHWEATDKNQTKLKMKIRFRRDLSPSWYFTPIEQFWVGLAGEYFLNTIF